jgi:hypothetical protein
LIGDEVVEIGVAEHAARALRTLADADVAEIARGNVGVKRLDRAAQLARGLGGRAQAIRRPNAGLPLPATPAKITHLITHLTAARLGRCRRGARSPCGDWEAGGDRAQRYVGQY